MDELSIPGEATLRLAVFFGVLATMLLWECLAPCRQPAADRGRRWSANLGLVAIDALLVRLAFPLGAVALGAIAEERGMGLLGWTDWARWLEIFLAVVLLDLAIYLQHVLAHAVPAFWRLHRVHHSDRGFDATTGVRFHPLEILLSMTIKFAVIVALGAPAIAVLAFELLLNAGSLFNHGNVRLPSVLDRALRTLIVTPDMHRLHHSVLARELNSNFGFNLSLWDRLFGTYRREPQLGHRDMLLGVAGFEDPRQLGLPQLLGQPFANAAGAAHREARRATPSAHRA